ncbi:MAG: MFS transporter [Betaproteobacteria bacterium]|nr:MFS transporter [Betaproteobacteria bacterium]
MMGGVSAGDPQGLEPPQRWKLLIPLIVAIAFLMEQLDATIVTTAIPDMAHALHTTAVQMNLAVSAYILTLGVFIPLSGWCADRYGTRRVFTAALAVFTLGSALCGFADSFAMPADRCPQAVYPRPPPAPVPHCNH